MTRTLDPVETLRASEKFRAWKKPELGHRSYLMKEVHYAPDELAELWGVSTETIRSIFRNEEGVLKIGDNGTRTKRAYITLRIPESVAERVHKRLSA